MDIKMKPLAFLRTLKASSSVAVHLFGGGTTVTGEGDTA
jgi:hypothetical protein